jgi:signal transduction histidine kinase
VQIDTDKIKQVLTNLIGNSLKFTDAGSISVSIRDIGTMVEVDVTDTGVGIAKKDQQKLFSKFEQVAVSGDRPSGTGLGLYISREIIGKLGGQLWIKASEVGHGTTMTFTLPKVGTPKALSIKTKIIEESRTIPDQK